MTRQPSSPGKVASAIKAVSRIPGPALLAAVWVVAALALLVWSSQDQTDFATFYEAASRIRNHANLYNLTGYPPHTPWVRPAWQALMYLPFTWVTFRTAYFLWSALSVTLLLASLWAMKSELASLTSPRRILLALLLGLLLAITLTLGQDSTLFLFLLVLALRSLRAKHAVRAGVFLGLAAFKLHLLLGAFALLAFRRKWRLLAATGVVGALEFAVSVVVAGPHWVRDCLKAQAATLAWPNVATVYGLLFPQGAASLALPLTLLALILVTWALRNRSLDLAISASVLAAVVFSWHAYLYDYLCILPAWAYLPGKEVRPAVGGSTVRQGSLADLDRNRVSAGPASA